jgi:hypothetical protein
MTSAAVEDLFGAVGRPANRWLTSNITAGLLLASLEVIRWEGEEWAVESGPDGAPVAWAEPGDLRTPYAWLRARCTVGEAAIDIYQDDSAFGLSFTHFPRREVPEVDVGSLRSRRDIPLVRGPIKRVDVVCDTLVKGALCPGVVTEALLRGDSESTLLIAAEAYSRAEWHLYDESVVALSSLADADKLQWLPPRRAWRPTKA